MMDSESILLPRACGKGPRKGMIYLKLEFSKYGVPFKNFIIDPVIAIPPDVKSQIKDRGMSLVQMDNRKWVVDHVGSNNYPNPADFIEEVGRLGLHNLIEKTFPFKDVTPDMWIMFSHNSALVNDTSMLLKYYDRDGRDEDNYEHVVQKCPNPDDVIFNLHMENGNASAGKGHFCAGLHWSALQDWDLEKEDEMGMVLRKMPAFDYTGKKMIPNTVFHPGFILAFPFSSLKFQVYEDDEGGQHEKALTALEALPKSLQGNINLSKLTSAEDDE